MKLRFYSWLMQLCEFLAADLHRTERHLQAVRVWAWQQATKENLSSVNTRIAARRIS